MKKRPLAKPYLVRLDTDLIRYLRERALRERRSAASVLRQVVAEAAAKDQQQTSAA